MTGFLCEELCEILKNFKKEKETVSVSSENIDITRFAGLNVWEVRKHDL